MAVTLKLFSSLMEYLPDSADGNAVTIASSSGLSCHDLIDRYKIPRDIVQVVMVNGEYVAPELRDKSLNDGDTVAIWPSIQGG